ncbi:hypothetical protein [Moraxella lacunata]
MTVFLPFDKLRANGKPSFAGSLLLKMIKIVGVDYIHPISHS